MSRLRFVLMPLDSLFTPLIRLFARTLDGLDQPKGFPRQQPYRRIVGAILQVGHPGPGKRSPASTDCSIQGLLSDPPGVENSILLLHNYGTTSWHLS